MKLRHGFFIILAGCGGGSTPATATGLDASVRLRYPEGRGRIPDAATPDDVAAVDVAATGDAAFDDAGTDAGPPCNTIANDAPVVNTTEIAADPPAPQAGHCGRNVLGDSPRYLHGPDGASGRDGHVADDHAHSRGDRADRRAPVSRPGAQ